MARIRKSSRLAKLFGTNLDKLMRHHRLSGNGVASAAKAAGIQIDPKTVNNARGARREEGMGDPTLITVEEIAAGVSAAGVPIEPWQLFASRFDPLRLPELRKRSGDTSVIKSSDAYLDELVALWPRMKPGRRASLLHQAYEWAMESQEDHAPPPHPPRASQETR